MTSKPRGIMGATDPGHIDMGAEYEIAYWSEILGVTKLNLIELVGKVGNSVGAIRLELGRLP